MESGCARHHFCMLLIQLRPHIIESMVADCICFSNFVHTWILFLANIFCLNTSNHISFDTQPIRSKVSTCGWYRRPQKRRHRTLQSSAVIHVFSAIYQLFPQDQWVKILQVKYSPGRRVSSFACSKSLHPWHSSIVSPGQEFDITGTPQKACTTLKLGFGHTLNFHFPSC